MIQRTYSIAEIQYLAPSVFTTHASPVASDRYGFVPTSTIVEALFKEGFVCSRVQETCARGTQTREYTRHMLKFRHPNLSPFTLKGTLDTSLIFPEVTIDNSHNTTSAFHGMLGFFRQICSNGMLASAGSLGAFRVRHSKNQVGEVIDATYRIIGDLPELTQRVQRWTGLMLTESQQNAFAEQALALRWDNGEAPVTAQSLLQLRRPDDRGNSLWHTFNVVQENLMKGGLSYQRLVNHRRSYRHTRGIRSVHAEIDVNKQLWALADELVGV